MKILVGISGGVDSALAAKKLIDQGHDVHGAVLIMHEYTELSAAREAAESVGFTNRSFFIRLYKRKYGHTPKQD